MNRLICIFILLSIAMFSTGEEVPSEEIINKWWSEGKEETEILTLDKIVPVTLLMREQAFLAVVYIGSRGRNDLLNTMLIRPSDNDVVELGSPFGQQFEVKDLDNDGISEIITDASGSGQGSIVGNIAVVHLNGSIPVVLKMMEYSDNSGAVSAQDPQYYSNNVTWDFIDLNDDGNLDLKETTRSEKGRSNKDPIVKESINLYVFKNGEFISYIK